MKPFELIPKKVKSECADNEKTRDWREIPNMIWILSKLDLNAYQQICKITALVP